MQETWVWSLGQEDPLEKGMATHSSIPTWRIPWTEEPGGLESMGLQRVRQDWVAHTFTFIVMITIPVTLSSHWTVSAARCTLGTGGPITQAVDAAYLALCLSRPLRSRDWRTYHPGCRRCLPDIVSQLPAALSGLEDLSPRLQTLLTWHCGAACRRTARCLQWLAAGAVAASSGSAGNHLPGSVRRNAERRLARAGFVPWGEKARRISSVSWMTHHWALTNTKSREHTWVNKCVCV